MLKSRTNFPYELNDRLGNDYIKEGTNVLVDLN